MSADNGIYILQTPTGSVLCPKVFEYRVVHAQAIDNIYWQHTKGNPKQVVSYFGKCEVFTNEGEARKLAFKMEEEVLNDDFCPVLEYGINTITLPHPFQYYKNCIRLLKKNNPKILNWRKVNFK